MRPPLVIAPWHPTAWNSTTQTVCEKVISTSKWHAICVSTNDQLNEDIWKHTQLTCLTLSEMSCTLIDICIVEEK